MRKNGRLYFKWKRGSTSVLVMLLLLAMLLFIGAVCEAASATAASGYCFALTESAGRSVLSMYHSELLQDYGLFGAVLSEDEIRRQMEFYILGSLLQDRKGSESVRTDALKLKLQGISIESGSFALSNLGLAEKQVIDHMRYRVIRDLAVDLCSVQGQKRLSTALEEAQSSLKEMETVGGSSRLINKAQAIFERYDDELEQIADMKERWEMWQRYEQEGKKEDAEKIKAGLEKQWGMIAKSLGRIERDITKIQQQFPGEERTEAQILEELKQIKSIAGEKRQLRLDELEPVFAELEYNEGAGRKTRKQLRRLIKKFERQSGLVQAEEHVLRNKKLIAQLPSTELSAAPGIFIDFKTAEALSGSELNRIYLAAYGEEKFLNQTKKAEELDGKPHFFQNETEYLLSGRFSDRENSTAVQRGIFTLRLVCNMVHLYTDSGKRNEIQTLALSLAPGPGAAVTEFLISMAWSYAESTADVRTLLSGGRIPLLKRSGQWQVDLSSVLKEKPHLNEVREGQQDGLNYTQYLSLFLLMQNREVTLVRMLDLIQLNIQGRYDPSFRIADCRCGFLVQADFSKNIIMGIGRNGTRRNTKAVMTHVY